MKYTTEQLEQELERLATSLLTDEEICMALDIDEDTLSSHYGIVERARVKLKSKLNAKRITEAAQGRGADDLVRQIPKSGKKGGRRSGAGRPRGSQTKMTTATMLARLANPDGEYVDHLAEAYHRARSSGDLELELKFHSLILNKVMASPTQTIEINETNTVENRQTAFLKALETIGTVALQQEAPTVKAVIPYDDK